MRYGRHTSTGFFQLRLRTSSAIPKIKKLMKRKRIKNDYVWTSLCHIIKVGIYIENSPCWVDCCCCCGGWASVLYEHHLISKRTALSNILAEEKRKKRETISRLCKKNQMLEAYGTLFDVLWFAWQVSAERRFWTVHRWGETPLRTAQAVPSKILPKFSPRSCGDS